jgi:ubiquitin C-terminal hydrolase
MRPKILSTLTPEEGAASTQAHRYLTIRLPLGKGINSIADAMEHYAAEEEVEYQDEPHGKQMQLDTLPEVLTLVLSRFRQTLAGQMEKVTRQVTAPADLDLPDEFLSQRLVNSLGNQRARYRLLHVVHHEGETLRGGHYTSYGKLPLTGAWYQHDDTGAPGLRRVIPGAQDLQEALRTGYIYVYVRA